MLFSILLSLSILYQSHAATHCEGRNFGRSSIACVCNENYCDSLDHIGKTPHGVVQAFTSTKSGKRFEYTEHKFNDSSNPKGYAWHIKVDHNKKYQKIIGFGSALSDAAVLSIGKMSPKLQRQIISDFFSEKGIEYSVARTTIAGSDFSTRQYTYDDHFWDWDLKQWSLVDEDTKYRIPQMKIANEVAKHRPIKFFGSPWSGPAWLKTNEKITGKGTLNEHTGSKFWKTYATYILKWLQAYRSHGVEFWGMTVQNEPATGLQDNFPWNTMGYTPEMERDFLKNDLGPTLEHGGWGPNNFTIMVLDHNRDLLPHWADVILNDPKAAHYAKGVAVHWYGNGNAGPDRLDQVHNHHPNHFILATEACNGWQDQQSPISLGNWEFGESYAHDIIIDLTHWSSGWVDWNMVLDMTGGPIWLGKGHFESAPIIVNPEKHEYYKNPMYYAIGHFSKFLPPDSIRIGIIPEIVDNGGLQCAAFQRPDGGFVFIVINSWNDPQSFTLDDPNFGILKMQIEPHSFNTWVYYP